MATIALYANKINQMPGLIKDVKKSVTDYKSELSALKTKSLTINKSVCNLDDIISSIQTSSQTQEQKITSLDTFNNSSEEFISDAVRIDSDAADIIKKRKDDFYDKYNYLKPECEKSGWEKFCGACKSVGEWCKDNWKAIGKILITVVIVAALGIATALTGGILGVILAGAFWGALAGGLIGGVMGGITSAMSGGAFLDGFADGALGGAVTGVITGAAFAGIGALGAVAGKSIQCLSTLGKAITVTSKVTMAISLGMDGFDILSMGIGLFDPSNPLVKFNKQLHSNALYNGFQITVNAIAIFTAGAASTLKCFVAGTMILTAAGLVAIESIQAGDRVTSTNIDTFEVAEKTVIEAYIRETTELVHLTINGELIKTTFEHPFYVKDVGFVNAGELVVGNKVLDSSGNVLLVENIKVEITNEPTKVYNFQVDDFHTYHVGNNGVLVHNANYNKEGLKTNNPQSYLQRALKNQDVENMPARMKETWIEGDYKYTVRVHEGNTAYTDADSIYRVSRKNTVTDANGQGNGLQYLGTDGKWYSESVLKEFYKDGSKNPLFNETASKMTHIPVGGSN
ncbi:hypothetical protein CLHUN_32470 [Ruminiclostridium hungatei]|uniref:Hint domain-containing protein n=1 Tax=Ruminiclostridium hungatei TaxID=48256 RepID=A0A1V4SGR1_RUMHU|nr:polymorphic toxin-type HINT domain-containing protein [Ruminiclostridium hungatei]OPX42923.1 hypothetical protein CLHUN_32470 [Ruminiclostridium hungatei]